MIDPSSLHPGVGGLQRHPQEAQPQHLRPRPSDLDRDRDPGLARNAATRFRRGFPQNKPKNGAKNAVETREKRGGLLVCWDLQLRWPCLFFKVGLLKEELFPTKVGVCQRDPQNPLTSFGGPSAVSPVNGQPWTARRIPCRRSDLKPRAKKGREKKKRDHWAGCHFFSLDQKAFWLSFQPSRHKPGTQA